MGLLVNGEWKDQWYDTESTGGHFQRQDAKLRNWVTRDGSAGPTGETGFKAEAGRYHLYVCNACPWAHRTLIFRALKGLEEVISVSAVHWRMRENGWEFHPEPSDPHAQPATEDHLHGYSFLHQLYTHSLPDYSGRVTVPLLWDRKQDRPVSNESSEIIRMLNSAFDDLATNELPDMYPEELREEIDAVNEDIYHNINNGVYKTGFATTQDAYEEAFDQLFAALERTEKRLEQNRYLLGDRLTEADWRLFTTLIRFDPVYVGHFKCNDKPIQDYPSLWGYTRELYQMPHVARTVHHYHIKAHYYGSHDTINPTLVIPKGPEIDFDLPHGRG